MDNNFSQEITILLNTAQRLVRQHNCSELTPEFVLLAMRALRDSGWQLLSRVAANDDELENIFSNLDNELYNMADNPVPAVNIAALTNRVVRLSALEARILKSENVSSAHILLAIFHNPDVQNMEFFNAFRSRGIDYGNLSAAARRETSSSSPVAGAEFIGDDNDEDDSNGGAPLGRGTGSRGTSTASRQKKSGADTPMLDKFGHDMTRAAAEGRLDPVVGRETEIEPQAQVLSRPKENKPVLVCGARVAA